MAIFYSEYQESQDDKLVTDDNGKSNNRYHDEIPVDNRNNLFSPEDTHQAIFKYSQFKTKLQTTKFIEKSDIISISVTYNLLDKDELYSLVLDLCTKNGIDIEEFMKIMKRIIALEKLDLLAKIISAIVTGALSLKSNRRRIEKLAMQDEFDENMEKSKQLYDHTKLISDLFGYSIFAKKLDLSFYLFRRYRRYVSNKSG